MNGHITASESVNLRELLLNSRKLVDTRSDFEKAHP